MEYIAYALNNIGYMKNIINELKRKKKEYT